MTLAELETRSYTFVALGKDQEHAEKVIEATWNAHVGPDPENKAQMYSFEDLRDSVSYTDIAIGEGFRDGHRIVESDKVLT